MSTVREGMPVRTLTVTLRQRRLLAIGLTSVLALSWLVISRWIDESLGRVSLYSGFSLLACLLWLALIGLRKRLIALPLWSVSTWVQIHVYTALFSCVVYVVHVPGIIARGTFELPLSLLFLAVSLSGFYGLYLSRTVPRKLASLNVQPRFERVQWHRDQTKNQAVQLIDKLGDTADATVLREHYERQLATYFDTSLALTYFFYPTTFRRRSLLRGLGMIERYLSGETAAAAKRLAALVRHRDDLDFQHAMQLRLRSWIVFHSVCSSVLVIWSLVHAFVALGMSGN